MTIALDIQFQLKKIDRIMRYLFISIIYVIASCNSKTKEFDNRLELLRGNGYMFCKTINLNRRICGDSIKNQSNAKLPFYAIKITNEKIYTYKFDEDKTYSMKDYSIFKDYLLCTTISKELEFENLYLRKIEVIRNTMKIIYTYQISENFEFLNYIDFIYENGKNTRYYNCNYRFKGIEDYKVNIREQDVSSYYPNFKVDCE
jgi:hypothetical protein